MQITVDKNNRVIASCDSPLVDGIEVTPPDGWKSEEQHDWRLEGTTLIHDPVADVPADDPVDAALVEIAELASDNAARLDEQDAALVELADLIGG